MSISTDLSVKNKSQSTVNELDREGGLSRADAHAHSISCYEHLPPSLDLSQSAELSFEGGMHEAHTLPSAKAEQIAQSILCYRASAAGPIILCDPRLPDISIGGDDEFKSLVIQDLEKLLQADGTKELLSQLKNSERSAPIVITKGALDEAFFNFEDNQIEVSLSYQLAFAICKQPDGEMVLEPLPSEVTLAHELTHVLHEAQGSAAHSEVDHTGFDTAEEKATIGTLDNLHSQQLTENAYRRDLGYLPRVGHFGASPDTLNEPEILFCLFKNSIQSGKEYSFLTLEQKNTAVEYLFQDPAFFANNKKLLENLMDHAASNDLKKSQFGFRTLDFIMSKQDLKTKRSLLLGYAIKTCQSRDVTDFLIERVGKPSSFLKKHYNAL